MKTRFIVPLSMMLCVGCGQSTTPVQQAKDSIIVSHTDTVPFQQTTPVAQETPYPAWMNPLILRYIDSTFKHQVSWLWDQYKETDTATFAIFHLGHSFENHFNTDGWLYIDTISRRIYAYDLPADSLVRWDK